MIPNSDQDPNTDAVGLVVASPVTIPPNLLDRKEIYVLKALCKAPGSRNQLNRAREQSPTDSISGRKDCTPSAKRAPSSAHRYAHYKASIPILLKTAAQPRARTLVNSLVPQLSSHSGRHGESDDKKTTAVLTLRMVV